MEQLLKELCAAAGVGGASEIGMLISEKLAEHVPEVHTDALGNIWGVLSSADEKAPVLLLEAHMDEIGFIVTDITSDGFLRVHACGGADDRTLAAQQVVVLCDPPLHGVFCSTPPHLSK